MTAYYNEFDPYAAAWLRNLIAAGHIAPGEVDERSIEDVRPSDLRGFAQCHFFAGIGVWSYALRNAGWDDDRPVWTGSCPCQPFSAAGKGAGFADERHLWPDWFHLISECRPPRIYGEQVASSNVGPWIDLVQDDMEGLDYAVGAVPFPSAGVGAPHIRDRTYFVADAQGERWDGRQDSARKGRRAGAKASSVAVRMAHANGWHPGAERQQRGRQQRQQPQDGGAVQLGNAGNEGLSTRECSSLVGAGRREEGRTAEQPSCAPCRMGHADGDRAGRNPGGGSGAQGEAPVRTGRDDALPPSAGIPAGAGPTNGLWRNADWLRCRDGKWRPVEPGTFPLAHGAASRVGRLRAYGNAINAQAAETFIRATL